MVENRFISNWKSLLYLSLVLPPNQQTHSRIEKRTKQKNHRVLKTRKKLKQQAQFIENLLCARV